MIQGYMLMKSMDITVFQEHDGWYVFGTVRMGPFFSRERALDLAYGMAAAICSVGEHAVVTAGPDDAKPAPAFARFARLMKAPQRILRRTTIPHALSRDAA